MADDVHIGGKLPEDIEIRRMGPWCEIAKDLAKLTTVMERGAFNPALFPELGEIRARMLEIAKGELMVLR
jgi:hypothetical protein